MPENHGEQPFFSRKIPILFAKYGYNSLAIAKGHIGNGL
jgi:hypothetical protein